MARRGRAALRDDAAAERGPRTQLQVVSRAARVDRGADVSRSASSLQFRTAPLRDVVVEALFCTARDFVEKSQVLDL